MEHVRNTYKYIYLSLTGPDVNEPTHSKVAQEITSKRLSDAVAFMESRSYEAEKREDKSNVADAWNLSRGRCSPDSPGTYRYIYVYL